MISKRTSLLLTRFKISHSFKPSTFLQKSFFSSNTNDFSGLGNLNHVAIVTPNLDRSAYFYKSKLGAKVSEKVPLPDHGVYTVFVDLGNTKLELLYPLGDKSPIANFLKKNPAGGIHHICIEVEDIHKALKIMKENNVRALDPEPKVGSIRILVVLLQCI